jgi:hypothetical protein
MGRSLKFANGRVPAQLNPLKLNPSTSGGEETGPLLAPEEKAASTRGQILTGKIRFDQYELLVACGFPGEEVMRWTEYHADKVIRAKGLVLRLLARRPLDRPWERPDWVICRVCGAGYLAKNEVRHMRRIHNQGTVGGNTGAG